MTKFKVPPENCQSTIRFMHNNITDKPLAVSVVLPSHHYCSLHMSYFYEHFTIVRTYKSYPSYHHITRVQFPCYHKENHQDSKSHILSHSVTYCQTVSHLANSQIDEVTINL
jgi:hypothetical protein